MTKPTLVQSLLNLPSQTYGNVDTRPKKEYYSTRQEMLRIAASAQEERGELAVGTDGGAIPNGHANPMTKRAESMVLNSFEQNPSSLQAAITLAHSQQRLRPQPEDDSDDSDLEVFFTPNTSPRTSMASSVATITFPSSRKPSRRSLKSVAADSHQPLQLSQTDPPSKAPTTISTAFVAVPSTRTPSTSSSQATRARHALSASSSLSSTSLDGHSIFSDYFGSGESTLLSTPYQSDSGEGGAQAKGKSKASNTDTVRSTSTDARWRNQHRTNEDWAKDVNSSTPVGSGTKTRTSASVSPASTSSANPGKGSGDKSSGLGSVKKSVDSKSHNHSPPPNPEGQSGVRSSAKGKEKENSSEKEKKPSSHVASQPTAVPPSNVARSNKKYVPPKQPHTFSAFASIPVPEHTVTTSTQKASHPLPNGHGISKATPASSSPKSSSSTVLHVEAASAPSLLPPNNDSYIPTYKYPPGPSQKKTSLSNQQANTKPSTSTQRRKPSAPKPPPSTMMGMDALLEEDEDGPLTPRMESKTLENRKGGWDWGSEWEAEHEGRKAALGAGGSNDSKKSSSSQESPGTGRSRSLRHTTPTELRRRRSRSLDSSSSTSTTRKPHAPPQTLSAEVEALVQGFVSPGERPSKGTQGYTSLVLPRAPPPALNSITASRSVKTKGDGWLSADGKIDLTKSGVAQTTMATVEVVKGLGSKSGSGILGFGGKLGFGRRRASSGPRSGHGPAPLPLAVPSGAGARPATSGENGQTPAPTIGVRGSPLGFTSYRSPPNYVPSESVLVQVWAVGVDGVDGRLVGIKFGGGGAAGRAEEDENMQTDHETEEERAHETELEEDNEERRGEENAGTSPETTPTKKGGLAALGRSLSLRLSRAGSSKQKAKQADLQRSASAAAASANTWSKAKQDQEKLQQEQTPPQAQNAHKRSLSFSLKRSNTAASQASTAASVVSSSPGGKNGNAKKSGRPKETQADVGYIPGRSFVGRVLECGWDVRDEVIRKGEWVVGLLDVRKAGALAEFIVVDRHRVRRVPQPREGSVSSDPSAPTAPVWSASSTSGYSTPRTLTLDELALLPLCGLPAYRAVRTFMFAFSSIRDGNSTPSATDRRNFDFGTISGNRTMADHDQGYRRRVLVLRGHDGAGAMAVQMLVRRGWRVSVHVPFSSVPAQATQGVADRFMHVVEERAREWGADEVIFDDGEEGGGPDDGRGAAVRVLDTLREDGDVFDAVLDTIGGKEIREAGERLLRSHGSPTSAQDGTSSPSRSPTTSKRRGIGQFTTLVGDVPERTIPSAGDNFRAGLRSLRLGSNDSAGNGVNGAGSKSHEEAVDVKGNGKVGYAWVSVAQDVDWEGDDVGETLGAVVRLALEDGVRPLEEDVDVSGNGSTGMPRYVPFEQAPSVFVDNGPLRDGSTVVVKVAA